MDANLRELIKLLLKMIYDFQYENNLIPLPQSVALKINLKEMTDKKLLEEYTRQLDGLIGVKEEVENQLKSKRRKRKVSK